VLKFIFTVLAVLLFLLFFVDQFAKQKIHTGKMKLESKAELKKEKNLFIIHKVKRGENLWKISKMYFVDFQSIKKWNKLKGDKIRPNQRLKIFGFREATASWYGKEFHGRKMANGRKFNMYNPDLAAHKYLPEGSKILVIREIAGDEGKEIKRNLIEITDRGPYIGGRDFDLSYSCAKRLNFLKEGVIKIKYRVVSGG